MKKNLLITGGAGFIGSNLILRALEQTEFNIVNVDKLTYSGNLESLASCANNPRYDFIRADVADQEAMAQIFNSRQPDYVMHLAAESHVDRSIDNPQAFIHTNIEGTFSMLETARQYWKNLKTTNPAKASAFKFLHISTDEVFGDLSLADKNSFFNEKTPYSPSSPYSASKAASDHLVHAWQRTYGLPALITNCSNNYGPRQFPEKLIPLVLINALGGKPLPVYGEGKQIRDWLYVADHADALLLALQHGAAGETYAIGAHNEQKNIDVVKGICAILEKMAPDKPAGIKNYADLITFVQDRPGHDGRYAIDASKITRELGWKPVETFESGLEKTVAWYLDNPDWWQNILTGKYQCQRLGTNI